MMKHILGSKALSRVLSFLLIFLVTFCQLPTGSMQAMAAEGGASGEVRFIASSNGQIFKGKPELSANIYDFLEGTPFQMDTAGNLTGNAGIIPECFDYRIFVTESISEISFDSPINLFKLFTKEYMSAHADFYLNGEKMVSGDDSPTVMAFAMQLIKNPIELKNRETEFSFVLWGDDKKTTTTYRFNITKLSNEADGAPYIDAVEIDGGVFAADEGFISTEPVTYIDVEKLNTPVKITFTPPEGVSLYRGTDKTAAAKLPAGAGGKYTVTVPAKDDFVVTASKTLELYGTTLDFDITYTFKFNTIDGGSHEPDPPLRSDIDIVDRIVDYVPAPSGYTTTDSAASGAHDGVYRGVTAWSRFSSIGAFGGYMTFAFDKPITNDSHNPYGIDFIVYGNGYGTNKEPGGVLVSQDGKKWYTLAGSMHYELTTDWSVPSKKLINGKVVKSVQIARDAEGKIADVWPLLPIFGYVDNYLSSGNEFAEGSYKVTAEAGNPYNEETVKHIIGDGFDLTWAVDENGKPVQLDQITYIRVQNVTDIQAYGVLSPEIGTLTRTKAAVAEVGQTAPLTSLTVNGQELIGTAPQQSTYNGAVSYYEIDLKDKNLDAINVKAIGQKDDSIVINNERYIGEAESKLLLAADGSRMLRVIAQNGRREPVSYIIKCTGGGDPFVNSDLDWVKLSPGEVTQAIGKQSEISFDVASNVENIKFTASSFNPNSSMTLKGGCLTEEIALGYRDSSLRLKLHDGENIFNLTVTAADKVHSTVYKIVVNRKPIDPANACNVVFCFTGDALHGFEKDGSPKSGHDEQVWIAEQKVVVPKGANVKYLTDMMLYNAEIDFDDTDGTYIAKVKSPKTQEWVGEFSNGSNSGWMYRYNGEIANVGYAAKALEEGAAVRWFYTDDYTQVPGFDMSGGGSAQNTEAHWAKEAINFVIDQKLFVGLTTADFEPESAINAAMLVSALWRLADMDGADDGNSDDRNAKALAWASENGIINGNGDKIFKPETNIAREDMAAILYNYAGYTGGNVIAKGDLTRFVDGAEVSDPVQEAMRWAVGDGLMIGGKTGVLSPGEMATRAEAATVLQRFARQAGK